MSERDDYPENAPCWVDALADDLPQAGRFYAGLLGWTMVGDDDEPGYLLARLRGRDVAGVAVRPAGLHAGWATSVRVADAEQAADRVTGAGGAVLDGPIDAAPAGRLVVVADPAGAPLCLWEPAGRAGAGIVNEPGSWAMSALQTPDPAAVLPFYAAAFGWRAEPWNGITLLRLSGYVGGEPSQPVPRDVVAVVAAADGPPRWAVDFRVADVDLTARRATELGGAVLAPPGGGGPLRQAVLADPGGAVFSVSGLPA